MSTTATGQWTQTTIAGHPCDIFEPAKPHEQGFVAMYLHGVHMGRLDQNPVYTQLFEQHGLRVISPHTKRSWWTDKICTEFDPEVTAEKHVLQRVLPYINERWGVQPPKIGLFGTSMGGQGALRFSFKYSRLFPVVAAISPAIDYHRRYDEQDETITQMYRDKEHARQETALLYVMPFTCPPHVWFACDPTDENWFDSSDKLQMKMYSMGIPHECDLTTRGGGHGWDYYNHMAPKVIEFLVSRLERERLRLV